MLAATGMTDRSVTAVNPEPVLITPGSTRNLPATAADQGDGPAATRTLMLASGLDGVAAQVVSGHGRTLDKARTASATEDLPLWATDPAGPLGASAAAPQELSGEQPAAGRTDRRTGLSGLAARHRADAGNWGSATCWSPEGSGLAEVTDTAGGLVSVGRTDRGALWRAEPPAEELPAGPGISGTATSWARIVDDQGEIIALLPSSEHQVHTDLSAVTGPEGEPLTVDPDRNYYVEIASERAQGWHADLNGEPLRTVTSSSLDVEPEAVPWMRQYHLPAEALTQERAELVLGHRSDFQYPILLGIAGVLVLFVLIAVPLPRSWRILEVRA